MIVSTVAVCVGCWATLIFAATRGVHNYPGAALVADAQARTLLKWAIGAIAVGCGVMAVRLVVEMAVG